LNYRATSHEAILVVRDKFEFLEELILGCGLVVGLEKRIELFTLTGGL